jgi:membrane protease YdiL (CAAX protease family)
MLDANASLSDGTAAHFDAEPQAAQPMRVTAVVGASFVAYVVGLPLAAILAGTLVTGFAWVSGFVLGYLDFDPPEFAPLANQMRLVVGAITWLGLVFTVMRYAARRALPVDRHRAVWCLSALISLLQFFRLSRPYQVIPGLGYRHFVPQGAGFAEWQLFLSDLPRHPSVLLFALGALPALAWFVIRRRARSEERAALALREAGSPPPLLDAPRTSAREVSLVLGSTLGLFLLNSLFWIARAHDRTQLHFTTARIATGTAAELALIAFWRSRLRGRWTARMISARWRPSDALHAILLVLVTQLVYRLSFVAVAVVDRPLAVEIARYRVLGPLSLWIAVAAALVNPVFEEILYFGFTANLVRRRFGYRSALWSAVLIRLVMHAYQGPLALVAILPLGMIWTLYYLRTGRLWPIVVAHVIFDLAALGSIASKSM